MDRNNAARSSDTLSGSLTTFASGTALYSAKETRGGTFCFFTSELRDAASKTAMLGERLRDAVDRGELKLAYQPLVDPVTNEVKCFEALLRWQHPTRGLLAALPEDAPALTAICVSTCDPDRIAEEERAFRRTAAFDDANVK